MTSARMHDKRPSRAPACTPRRITRPDMRHHYIGSALATCQAIMVDADLSLATARARLFDTLDRKRLAASKYIRALGFAFHPAERDLDALVVEIFDKMPFARPAAWGPIPEAEDLTRRGGADLA